MLDNHPILIKDQIETRYFVTLEELGPFAADIYLASYLDTALSTYIGKNSYDYLIEREFLVNTPSLSPEISSSDPLRVDAADILTMKELLEEFTSEGLQEESFVVPNEWISPKLRILVNELCARRHNSFQCMIFVEQRQIAVTLAWILSRISELKSWIFPGAIIGHGGGRSASIQGMVYKKQKQTLDFFRSGAYNLLVSTSVGEEGLDFQVCMFSTLMVVTH